MALDNLDASIPLQAGNIQIGDPRTQNAFMQMQMRMQQLRQVQQSENALRQLYGTPGNLDESGRPTANAMGQLMQRDPRTGMAVTNQLAQMSHAELVNEVLQGKVTEAHKATAHGIGVAALNAYKETFRATNDPKLALQRMSEVRDQELKSAVADGTFSPQMAQKFPPPDPILYESHSTAYEAAHTKPLTQAQKIEFGFKADDQQRAQSRERREEAQFARGDTAEPKNIEVTASDGSKKTTTGAWDKDSKQWVTTDGTKTPIEGNVREVGTKGTAADLSPSKEIAVVDKDGAVIDRFAARESKTGPGWVRSDTGKPVEVPPGGKVDVGQAAGAVIGSRENVYIGRVLEAGITSTSDLENVSKMPMTVSSGVFGGRKQGPGLLDATKEVLTNRVTTQDVQIYNSANSGLKRSLAAIETSGLAPSGSFTDQFDGVVIKEGDSQLARLYKMANARQIVENGMAVIAANPRVAPEQKKLASTFLSRVQAAIPWTTSDVIKLQTSDDPEATLHNLGVSKTGKGEKSEAPASTPTPAGKAAIKAGGLDVTEAEYNKLPAGAAYTVPGDPTVRYKH